MSGSRKVAALVAGGVVALSVCSATASAQLQNPDAWRYDVTPYAWLTGLNGTVGIGRVAADVDLSVSDVLNMLNFGIMGAAEARKGRWVLALDGIYASLGDGRTIAIRGDTGGLEFSQRETIIQPVTGYTYGNNTWSLDLLGGFRYWNLRATLDVDRPRASNRRTGSRQWVDATGGFKFRWIPYERVRFVAAADGGGGGSRHTWQAYSSLGYDAWSRWTLGFAYRALEVDYDRSDFLFDTRTKGFIFGATYRPK